jgi:hypothetical protein
MKDTKELRSFLVQQMNGIVEGTVTGEQAKSVSNIAQQIYNTLNIEVKIAVAKQKVGEDGISAVSFVD